MSRVDKLCVIATVLVGMAIILMACSDPDGPGDDEQATFELPDDSEQWFDVLDEAKGRSFRCILWTKTNSSGHLGLSSFCYEPYKGAGE